MMTPLRKYFLFQFAVIYLCFTHSNGILFESKNADEAAGGEAVVTACKEHPSGITNEKECTENLKCFPQDSEE